MKCKAQRYIELRNRDFLRELLKKTKSFFYFNPIKHKKSPHKENFPTFLN